MDMHQERDINLKLFSSIHNFFKVKLYLVNTNKKEGTYTTCEPSFASYTTYDLLLSIFKRIKNMTGNFKSISSKSYTTCELVTDALNKYRI